MVCSYDGTCVIPRAAKCARWASHSSRVAFLPYLSGQLITFAPNSRVVSPSMMPTGQRNAITTNPNSRTRFATALSAFDWPETDSAEAVLVDARSAILFSFLHCFSHCFLGALHPAQINFLFTPEIPPVPDDETLVRKHGPEPVIRLALLPPAFIATVRHNFRHSKLLPLDNTFSCSPD